MLQVFRDASQASAGEWWGSYNVSWSAWFTSQIWLSFIKVIPYRTFLKTFAHPNTWGTASSCGRMAPVSSVWSLFTKTPVESQSLLLKAAEVVFASGRNDFGQLGDSTRHSSYIHRCGWETYGQYTPPSETIAARVTRTYPVHLGIEILQSNGSHFVRCLQFFIASR